MEKIIEVFDSGLETTVQDYPGRLGYWYLGIPPSGPFDDYAFRLGNMLVGNPVGEAGLELTLLGPKLKFLGDAVIALTGADLAPKLNNEPMSMWTSLKVKNGDLLSFGVCRSGCRAYLTITGGIDVPLVYGSKSTYLQGQIGGIEGRKLKKGDIINVGRIEQTFNNIIGREVKPDDIPKYPKDREIRVILGPQDDYLEDDFLLEKYALGQHVWEISSLHNRTGVRLIGPPQKWKPADQRPPSGAHPSNINIVYCAIGAINVTGEVPIPLGSDGISITGFTSVATIISADLWKLGQAKARDKIRFRAVKLDEANYARKELEETINEKNIAKG